MRLLLALATASLAADVPRDWVEPATRHRVVRLSDDDGSTKFYFHQTQLTAGGDRMLINTPRGLATVDISKLPARSVEALGVTRTGNVILGAKTREVFYQRDGAVLATHIDSKQTREIAKLPPELRRCAGFALNADESLLAGSYVEPKDAPDGRLPPSPPRRAGARPSLEDTWALRLPRRLFTLNTKSGELRTFHASTDWLNHVQFSPGDPGLLMFCHEGPWHKVDRIWTIRVDAKDAVAKLVHKRGMEMEIAGHEFFAPDGKAVWFDLQTPRGKEFWLASRDLASGELTRLRVDRKAWSVHFNVSPDGRHFAGDGGSTRSVASPGNEQWIYLFTQKDGALEAEQLVDMSKHDYGLEPNVNFTPDGKWIVFQAQMHGPRHVYAVEVAKTE
jgi:oligogalacturonide lyase